MRIYYALITLGIGAITIYFAMLNIEQDYFLFLLAAGIFTAIFGGFIAFDDEG